MILALLCWAAVTANCEGGPEPGVRYRHEIAYVYPIGTQPCGYDDNGDPVAEYGACPIYAWTGFAMTGESPDPCLPMEPAEPPLGGIALMRVTVFDEADNEDCSL